MPDANSGMGSHREGHQERDEQPQQPGAKGKPQKPASPDEALDEALHAHGKTGQHAHDDRQRASE